MAKGKQLRRRSHLALKALKLIDCPKCKKKILPHLVCKNCGFYKSKEVVDVLAKEMKKQEKIKNRQK